MKAFFWIATGLGVSSWVGVNGAQARDAALTFELPLAVEAAGAAVAGEPITPASSPERLAFQPPSVAAEATALPSESVAPVPEPDVLPAPVDPPPTLSAGGSESLPPPPKASFEVAAVPPPALPCPDRTCAPPPNVSTSLEQSVDPAPAPDLFTGGANSLVARAVGSAEGTRTPAGLRTGAYYGHVDPGNGVWNLGSFSYQQGAQTPEEADQRQLQRLQSQAIELRRQAVAKGLELSLAEELNGIDLANQAPVAALDRGYIDWLYQARTLGMTGDEAILWARTRAFLDPDSGQWNAPGLGNTVSTISQDQERRMGAIARAIAAMPAKERAEASASNRVAAGTPPTVEAIADYIINLDLDFPS